jgi:hypothetical protein
VALLTPPFALGAAGQVLSGRLLRLSLGAVFRPAASGVQVVSGVLAGPANTQGELSLAGNLLTVQAFRAVIQSGLDATAGSYEVINDAAYTFPALTAQHVSQYRRSLVVVRVDDSQVSGVASTGTTDRGVLEVLDGPLAASQAATTLPTPAGSWLALGEVLIPPVGQTVTVTPYNPRTGLRHGILPVINDASTVAGHAGALPAFDGQARWHPVNGLEIASGGAWGEAISPQVLVPRFGASYAEGPNTAGYLPLRLYKYGRRCLLSGSFTYTGGGGAGAGAFAPMGSLPAGVVPAGVDIAPAVMTNGSAWTTAGTLVDATGSIQYAPFGATLPGASAGRIIAHHEFRSTT